jgi:hypothetical protein
VVGEGWHREVSPYPDQSLGRRQRQLAFGLLQLGDDRVLARAVVGNLGRVSVQLVSLRGDLVVAGDEFFGLATQQAGR